MQTENIFLPLYDSEAAFTHSCPFSTVRNVKKVCSFYMLKCAVYTWIKLMEMHYMGNLLNIMKNITDFSPGCESPELNSPRPSLKPHTNPFLLKHGPSHPHKHPPPPNLTASQKKTETFLCNSKSHVFALNTFHTLLCVHSPTKDSIVYVCLHAHALWITLHCSPASCLTYDVSLCTCIHLKLLYSLYFLVYVQVNIYIQYIYSQNLSVG